MDNVERAGSTINLLFGLGKEDFVLLVAIIFLFLILATFFIITSKMVKSFDKMANAITAIPSLLNTVSNSLGNNKDHNSNEHLAINQRLDAQSNKLDILESDLKKYVFSKVER